MDFFGGRVRIPWGTFANVILDQMASTPAAAGEVVDQLKEWGTHLTRNALLKWPLGAISPKPCGCPVVGDGEPYRCQATGLIACDVCGVRCCLAHARVDYAGDAICEQCIGEAKARYRASGRGPRTADEVPPPRPREAPPPKKNMTVPEALKTLKVRRGAGWDDVRKQYRKLVVEFNADRPQSDAQRAKNTGRLKKINAAFEVLKTHFEEKEAA